VTFEEDQGAYDQFDAQGFIKLNALRLRLGAMVGRGQGRGFAANLNLIRGDATTYANYVAELSNRAQIVQSMRAQQALVQQRLAAQQAADELRAEAANDLENRITNDLNLMSNLPATVTTRVQELGSDADKLHAETAKMQAASAKEHTLGGHRSVNGSQISLAIEQTNITENDAITSIRDRLTEVEQNGISALLDHVKEHDVTCQGLNATTATKSAFSGPPAELDDCIELENATPALESEVTQLVSAYENVFSTWKTENQKQQAIIRQSEH
jgi:hypothetical protein